MTLERRLTKLEAARGERSNPDMAATFAALVKALDRLAARKAAGCATVQRELGALVKAQ
jgi:hypothetical protein